MKKLAKEIKRKVKLGKYRHYKGGEYKVIGIAKHSETMEELVVYRNLYNHPVSGKNKLWVRPKTMFLENVNKNGKTMPRFEYIGKK